MDTALLIIACLLLAAFGIPVLFTLGLFLVVILCSAWADMIQMIGMLYREFRGKPGK